MKRAGLILAMMLALGGCWGKKASKADDQRTASGQILNSSTSDAMIAYDALTSRAPLAPHAAAPAVASSAEAPAADPQNGSEGGNEAASPQPE